MAKSFRESDFVDFNSGRVKVAPIQLQFRLKLAGPLRPSDLVRLFECRMEVWYLGVAVQMLHEIEFEQPPAIWSHAAYGLLALLFTYFEIIGKLFNPAATDSVVSALDFDCGFREVYGDPLSTAGQSYDPKEFYTRARNGLYQLGTTPHGLWVHNERTISTQDFDIIQKNPNDPATLKYYVNPHSLTRTLVEHFPTVIRRLNAQDQQYDGLRLRFQTFFGDMRER